MREMNALRGVFGCCTLWLALLALPESVLASASAPRIENSRIAIDATAVNLRAEGMQGGTSSSKSFFGKKKSQSSPDMPGQVDVGVVDVSGGAVLKNSDVRINTTASGISVRGGTIRVGAVAIGP